MIDRSRGEDGEALQQSLAALIETIGKAARELFDVDATLDEASHKQLDLGALLDSVTEPSLLVVLDVGGNQGLMVLDGPLVNAIVELMTGAADNSVYKEARVPTQIDKALCEDFCGQLLQLLPQEITKMGIQLSLPKLVWSDTETEAAKLVYKLERGNYGVLAGKIGFQGGIRGGQFLIALPQDIWDNGKGKTPDKTDNLWPDKLKENVLAAPLKLRADVDVSQISLSRVLAFQAGDVLTFSEAGLSDIALTDGQGFTVLKGRLGQAAGFKALAVTTMPRGNYQQTEPELPQAKPTTQPTVQQLDPKAEEFPNPNAQAENSTPDLATAPVAQPEAIPAG